MIIMNIDIYFYCC